MKFNDVQTLTKKVVAELMGEEYMTQHGYLEAIPSDKLVDVGVDASNSASTENIYKKFVTRVSEYYVINNPVNIDVPSIFKTSPEWGGMIGFISTKLADVYVDDMFNLVDGADYSTAEHTYYQAKVDVKYFNEAKNVSIRLSRNADALKEAWTSYEEMNKFLSAIEAIIQDTLDEYMNGYMHALLGAAIAISEEGTQTSIDLGTEAVAAGIIEAVPANPAELLTNPAFEAFAMQKIKEVRDNFKDRTAIYNDGTKAVSSRENTLVLLNKFDNAVRFQLKPNTYNVEMLNVGDYDTVNSWQAVKDSTGNAYNFDTVSKVMISADATEKLGIGAQAVTVENVIGLLFDRWALGQTKEFKKVTSSYTASGDFTTTFTHILVNYIINKERNIVAFTLN